MPRHVVQPDLEGERRPNTLWWSSPEAIHKRRSFVIATPALDMAKGLQLEHAVDLILQDAIARYRAGEGWSVVFSSWADHSGMLTQYVADLDLEQRTTNDQARQEFERLSRKWQRNRQRHVVAQLEKLGVAHRHDDRGPVGRDGGLGAQLFVELYERGCVERRQVLVSYCHRCGSAVTDSDLRVERVKGTARVFRAHVQGFGDAEIATLHPELLLTTVAVAASPDDLDGLAMVGSEIVLPVIGKRVPIVALGSRQNGLGRTLSLVAPNFNVADFEEARHQDWPATQLWAADGTVNEGFDGFVGLPLSACRERILELARSEGSLTGRFSHPVARAVHVACDAEVRPRLQWVWLSRARDMGNAAEQLIGGATRKFNHPAWQYSYRRKLAESTRPPAGQNPWWEGAPASSFHGYGSATDEVISERSAVGPRIPAAHCPTCLRTVVAVDAPAACGECGGAMEADTDVLRPSFGSALWTIAMAAQRSRPVRVDCAVLGRGLLESWIPTAELVAQSLYGETAIKHMLVHGAVHGRSTMARTADTELEVALNRWEGDAIRAAVFSAMADHEGAQEVTLDAGALEQGARVVQGIREGLAAVEVGEGSDIQYGAQLSRVEREVGRAMDSYHLGWAYRLVSSFVTKRLHPATCLSPSRYEALLALLRPFHPDIVRQAMRASSPVAAGP